MSQLDEPKREGTNRPPPKNPKKNGGGFLWGAALGILSSLLAIAASLISIYTAKWPNSSTNQKIKAIGEVIAGNPGKATNTLDSSVGPAFVAGNLDRATQSNAVPSSIVPIKVVDSRIIKASLMSAEMRGGQIHFNITLHNNTSTRAYVKDAFSDTGQELIFSGGQLSPSDGRPNPQMQCFSGLLP